MTDMAMVRLLKACPLLTQLYIPKLRAMRTCLDYLSDEMAILDLTSCKFETPALVRNLARFHDLQVLYLSYCGGVTDAVVAVVGQSCPSLQRLYLSRQVELTDAGVASAVLCRQLTVLNLSYCVRITDAALHSIADNLRLLNTLYLSHTVTS